MKLLTELSKRLDVVGAHVFTLEGSDGSYLNPVFVRNFVPLYGIPKESATGTSNCALACALT